VRRALVVALVALGAAAPAASAAGPAGVSGPASAPAQSGAETAPTDPNGLAQPRSLDSTPLLHRQTGRRVLRTASALPKIAETVRHHSPTHSTVFLKGPARWQVSFYDHKGREIGQVLIDDATGAVLEQWTGYQVAWSMARGYPGAFGRKINALYIWLPLLALFVAPFVDWRRPLRIRHLDLLAICSLSVSLAFFNNANIGTSVPLAYPPLLYLLGRLLWIALRRRDETEPREPMRLLVPVSWLAVACVFLMGFRVGLNVTDSNVIDVGYAGVIGADRIEHDRAIYGTFPVDNQHGDTYGPVNYEMYVPFEAAMPWHGVWDDLPAAHGAAVFFDLLCALLLFLVGRRVRGPTLGVMLAYAWAACPFTLYALNSNANDSLVGAMLLAALYFATRPATRGAFVALAALAKFAPAGVAPVFATHGAEDRGVVRTALRFTLGFAVTAAVVMLPVWTHGHLSVFWDRTVDYQATRGSPFSVWGLHDSLAPVQHVVQAGGALFAVAAAFIPRRRDVIGLAAMTGAVLIALELGVTHWFYLYVPWFLPFVLVAVLGREVATEPAVAQ